MGTYSSAARTRGINAARNAAVDANSTALNGGSVRIYSGTAPANADASLSGNTLLAQATLGSPAFGAAVNGVATANSITGDSSADATGTPTFFRLLTSGGSVEYQGTAGTSGTELILTGLTSGQIIAGGTVNIASLTVTQDAQY